MKKKFASSAFKLFFVICFIAFLTIYISLETGYYEYSRFRQKNLTEEEIKRFEQDIKDGKEISIDGYIIEEKNYKNKISNISLAVSENIEKYTTKGIEIIFGSIEKLIQE